MSVPIGKVVLLEQRMVKKESLLIHDKAGKPEDANYKVNLTLKAMGADCPTNELQIGDEVLTTKHAQEIGVKVVEGKMGDDLIIMHILMYYEDLAGREERPEELEETQK